MLNRLKKVLRGLRHGFNQGETVDVFEPGFNDLIRPNRIENGVGSVRINDKYFKALMVEGFPRSIDNRFISNLLRNHRRMDVSIRVSPYSQNDARRKVRRQLTKLEKDKQRKMRNGELAESIQNRLDDIELLHKKLDKGEESLFDVSVNVSTGADTKKGLRENTEDIRSEMNKQQLIPGEPNYKMLQAFKTTLPTTRNLVKGLVSTQPRSMPSGAVAELFPFAGHPSSLQESGILLGVNRANNQPVLTDFYNSINPNWIVMGASGSGKSFTAKSIINRYACRGVQTFVIDPHGEYGDTVRNLDGEVIELSIKKGNMINPLDLMGYGFREKINSLKEFYSILFDVLSSSQMTKLVKATRRAYRRNGIYQDERDSWGERPPKLEDVLQVLKDLKKSEGDRVQRKSFQAVIDRLEPFVSGSKDFLNTRTTVDPSENVVSFDIEDLPENCYPELMHLILNFLHSRMQSDDDRKMVVVDEAWELLSSAHGKNSDHSFVFRTVKTSRKYKLSLGLVVQEIHDLVSSRQGKAVLSNTANKLVMSQDRAAVSSVAKELNLNQREKEYVSDADTGEALLIKKGQRIPLKVHGTEKERQRDSETVSKMEEVFVSKDDLPDLESGVLLESSLDEDTVEALEKTPEWKRSTDPLFKGGFGKACWVKVEGQKSVEHERLVKGYKKWLKDRFDRVKETERFADVEIETGGGDLIGIEVETGKNLNHNIEAFEDKMERNDARYDDWFIVSTSKDLVERYSNYKETIIRTRIKDKIEGMKE